MKTKIPHRLARLLFRREHGFISLRTLIVLGASLTGFFLALLVPPSSSSNFAQGRPKRLTQEQGPFPTIHLEPVVSGLTQPTNVTNAGDGSGRIFIAQETGQILILINGSVLPTPFLDISDLVGQTPEHGLLGLAFHPDY